ncbi:MAG: DUF1592 domain-containing protein [Acidobacteria bacterium]|nr:DUF1592 domain-containing protein [Acidobacteriota bacterium]
MRLFLLWLSLPLAAVEIQPLLDKYCARCHGMQAQTAGINFTQPAALQNPVVLRKALRAVRENEMPPAGAQPSVEEREAMVRYFETEIRRQSTSTRNAGHVTLPRLNRVEYNNTIRDLTGIDLRPADSFPLDPPGESGFNNDREGLFISPLLIEKYLAAANYIVDEVLAAYRNRAPFHQVLEVEDMRNTETGSPKKPYGYDVTVVQNTIYEYLKLPRTGMYRFSVKAWGKPGKQGIPGVTVRLDGELVGQSDVTATADKPGEYTFQAPAKRGSRRLSLHFYNARPQVADVNAAQGAVLSLDAVRVESAGSTQNVFPEGFTGNTARQAITRFAANAWRRPLTKEEAESLLRTYRQAESSGLAPEEAAGVALKAVLVSPHFLFRTESSGDANKALRLTGYELASRLSYFLWQSMPDEELRRMAQSRKLSDPHTIEQQVARMLKDERSVRYTDSFATQWLRLRKVGMFQPDKKLYPDYDKALENSMIGETKAFFREVLQGGHTLRDLLHSDWSMMNGLLAQFYGLPETKANGGEFQRVSLPAESHRGGLLTQASILSLTSDGVRHRPVHRGVWVMESIFGKSPPPPPANVDPIATNPAAPKATLREKLEAHIHDANCASCHGKIDPLGLAFENYDAIGRWRTEEVTDGTGSNPKVKASGKLPDGREYQDAEDFKKLLLADLDAFNATFIEKLATYGLRRSMSFDDRDDLKAIAAAGKAKDYRLRDLVEAFVCSNLFQKR